MLSKKAITITSLVIVLFAPIIVYKFMRADCSADKSKTRSTEEVPEVGGLVSDEKKKRDIRTRSADRVDIRQMGSSDVIPSSVSDSEAYTILRPPLTGVSIGEQKLMYRLRQVQESDPARALELAREGNRLYPNSRYAAERAGRIVKSLALQGEYGQARGEAEKMVNTYAGTPWALEVERHTGAHPRLDR